MSANVKVAVNKEIKKAIIAPITSRGREGYTTRVKVAVNETIGWIVLDKIRSIDKTRLCEQIGKLKPEEILAVKRIIKEMLVD